MNANEQTQKSGMPEVDTSWITDERMVPPSDEPKCEKDEYPYELSPLKEFHRVLNYEDFNDVDEYLRLAERPLIIKTELIKNKDNPPKYPGYDYPKKPVEFIGKLTEIQSRNDEKGRRRFYCFTTLCLNKYLLVAFLKDTGKYSPSYDPIDLTNVELGSYWWCKAGFSKESHKITWFSAKELKEPCLRDIFQNPDPKFRPEGWSILNDKIIFDSELIEGKSQEQLEEFKIVVQPGKTTKYYGSVEGMLG